MPPIDGAAEEKKKNQVRQEMTTFDLCQSNRPCHSFQFLFRPSPFSSLTHPQWPFKVNANLSSWAKCRCFERILMKFKPVDSASNALHFRFWVQGDRTKRSVPKFRNKRVRFGSRTPSIGLYVFNYNLLPNASSDRVGLKRLSIEI